MSSTVARERQDVQGSIPGAVGARGREPYGHRQAVLARAILAKHKEGGLGRVFKFRKLEVTTKAKVRIYADNAQMGRTPASITAELSALQVILPS